MYNLIRLLLILSSNFNILQIHGMSRIQTGFVDCHGQSQYRPKNINSYKIENMSKNKNLLTFGSPSIHLCVRKLVVTIILENSSKFSEDEYIIVNDIKDPTLGKSFLLYNPIIIKMHRMQTQIIYPITAATSHCLKHSEAWYSVCKLQAPVVVQEMTLQIFQKIDNGTIKWIDLTRGQVLRLGTSYLSAHDQLPSILLSYSSHITDPCDNPSCPVDPKSSWLLFPTTETEEIMSECIFVSKEDISLNGQHFDEFYIPFDELLHIGDRCQQTISVCSTKRPLYLESYLNGTIRQYYMENLSLSPTVPLPSASDLVKGDFIALDYSSTFQSYIDIDIRADSNALIRKGYDLQIVSVVTNSMAPVQVVIESIVVNTGLIEGTFQPSLVNCTVALPSAILIKGPVVQISPMHRHVFLITIEGATLNESMSCEFEIRNNEEVRIAHIPIKLKKQSRCICLFENTCTCFASDSLSLLSLADYKDFGYHRSWTFIQVFASDFFKIEPLNVFLATFTILLLLGKLKIFLGFCSTSFRNFGSNYLHSCFKCCINPFMSTSNGSVSLQRTGTDVLLNMFFFVLYPFAIIWNGLYELWIFVIRSKYCTLLYTKTNRDRRSLIENERKSEKQKDLNLDVLNEEQYSLEDEDTEYVINAIKTLQKSSENSSYSRSNSL